MCMTLLNCGLIYTICSLIFLLFMFSFTLSTHLGLLIFLLVFYFSLFIFLHTPYLFSSCVHTTSILLFDAFFDATVTCTVLLTKRFLFCPALSPRKSITTFSSLLLQTYVLSSSKATFQCHTTLPVLQLSYEAFPFIWPTIFCFIRRCLSPFIPHCLSPTFSFFIHVFVVIHNCPKIFEIYLLSRFYFHWFIFLSYLQYYYTCSYITYYLSSYCFHLFPSCTTLQSSYLLLNSLVSTDMICLTYSIHQVVSLLPDVSTYSWSRWTINSLTLILDATQLRPQTCMLGLGYLLLWSSHFYTFFFINLMYFYGTIFFL